MVLLALDRRPVDAVAASAMLAAVAHRGDREPRLWCGEGVALGHAALPTTPEADHERLPASDASGRYWLTWDGRLDNRDELERDLGIARRSVVPPSDADYVLAAYARWGEECLHRLLGDWALAIWDAEARLLLCAKDPLGWRPLCYRESSGVLAVGSEPRQLFAGSGRSPLPDYEYLARFLAGALQKCGSTCYEGVRELEGGERLVVEGGTVRVEHFWTPPPPRDLGFRRFEEYVDEFETVFARATGARMRSNRPVAVALSGGLDSSYVAAVAAGHGGATVGAITAITLYAADAGLDEREHVRQVAGPLGLRHLEIDADDCWGFSSRWLADETWDAPDVPLPAALSVRLGQSVRELGCGVLLNGDGGDEWMDGDVRAPADALLHRKPRTAVRLARAMRPDRPPWRTLLVALLEDAVPSAVIDSLPGSRRPLAPVVERDRRWRSVASSMRAPVWQPRRGHAQRWAYAWRVSRPVAAWRERHAFAANGLDLRTPFHDLRVVELMASTPGWIKRRRGTRSRGTARGRAAVAA